MSPVWKRPQSSNQLVELQRPPKRSKQQSHADEKINFVSEPETEDSLLVGAGWRLEKGWAEAWSTEEPFPAALIPPNLVPSL